MSKFEDTFHRILALKLARERLEEMEQNRKSASVKLVEADSLRAKERLAAVLRQISSASSEPVIVVSTKETVLVE